MHRPRADRTLTLARLHYHAARADASATSSTETKAMVADVAPFVHELDDATCREVV